MKITICGSISQAEKLVGIYNELKELGHEPQMHPLMFDIASGKAEQFLADAGKDHAEVKRKHNFIKYWYNLIVSGDAIVVGNFDKRGIKNYIGGNTFLEIGFAHVNNKKVFLYNPIPEDVPYVDEIKVMVDLVLNGELRKLSFIEKTCDHTSVGMLVWKDEKLLLIERRKPPFAFAPPAGHCDGEEFEEIARRELQEEVGLVAKSLRLVAEGRKENHCRRIDGGWHQWRIFEAETLGELKRSESETKQAKWVSKDELKALASRTNKYLAGKISENEWEGNPGLEPVWYEWMKELKII